MRPDSERSNGWGVVAALAAGYVGIYLCRKNLAVALPLLQDTFSATNEEIGRIATVGTLAYAAGKIVNGPLVDRLGGRAGFLASLGAVALCGAAGALSPGLLVLSLFYGLNRFAGSAGWGAMMKLVPTWFGPARTATVIAVLSLSYVGGGVAATLLARQIVASGGGWRAVMGLPSAALLVIALACAAFVRRGPRSPDTAQGDPDAPSGAAQEKTGALHAALVLIRRPQFLVTCALSFTITLMRESFSLWNVHFLTSIQGGSKSVTTAALQSIGFDIMGALSILATGFAYDRTAPARRRWLMAGTLALLSGVLVALPGAASASPAAAAWLVAAVGLLVYGPYSLLAGVLAVESGGAALAATASGLIDSVGYIAGALAGVALGRLLDIGGYPLGLRCLAGVTAVSAVIALFMRPTR